MQVEDATGSFRLILFPNLAPPTKSNIYIRLFLMDYKYSKFGKRKGKFFILC